MNFVILNVVKNLLQDAITEYFSEAEDPSLSLRMTTLFD